MAPEQNFGILERENLTFVGDFSKEEKKQVKKNYFDGSMNNNYKSKKCIKQTEISRNLQHKGGMMTYQFFNIEIEDGQWEYVLFENLFYDWSEQISIAADQSFVAQTIDIPDEPQHMILDAVIMDNSFVIPLIQERHARTNINQRVVSAEQQIITNN
jgi:hypothetical protein